MAEAASIALCRLLPPGLAVARKRPVSESLLSAAAGENISSTFDSDFGALAEAGLCHALECPAGLSRSQIRLRWLRRPFHDSKCTLAYVMPRYWILPAGFAIVFLIAIKPTPTAGRRNLRKSEEEPELAAVARAAGQRSGARGTSAHRVE